MTKFGRMNFDEDVAEKAFMFYSNIYKDSTGTVVYQQKRHETPNLSLVKP